jgi:hypothetical protein
MKTSQILPLSFPRVLNRAVCFGALGLIAAGLVGSTSLQAQIVTYDISTANAGTSATVSPTGVASGLTAGLLSTTGTGAATSLAGSYLWKVWGPGASPSPGIYMQWSVQPDSSHQIDFTGAAATFSLVRSLHSNLSPGPDKWELDASTDNFATAGTFLATMDISASADQSQVPQSVALTPLGTAAPLTTVTFRLYGYNDTGTGGGGSSGLANTGALGAGGGNLLINGTVSAVPEPSSYAAVFGALAFGFVFLTRRLRKA